MSAITATQLFDRAQVARLRVTAMLISKKAQQYDERASIVARESWLHEGPAKGLSKQHRLTRVAGGWIPTGIKHDVMTSADLADDQARATAEQGEPDDENSAWRDDPGDLLEEDDVGVIVGDVAPMSSQAQVDSEATRWCGHRDGAWASIHE